VSLEEVAAPVRNAIRLEIAKRNASDAVSSGE